jgi:hypothetical protein
VKRLRFLLFVVVLLVLAIGVLVPLVWFRAAATLPTSIESASDIETALRQSIESERLSREAPKHVRERESVRWPTPQFAALPKALVDIYTTEQYCPDYLAMPKEVGARWNWRLINALRREGVAGPGRCEFYFARRIATLLRAGTTIEEAVMADRIHTFLSKEEVLAYDLASTWFERGVVGVEAASRVLMQRELRELDLAEQAELALAMPPYEMWDLVKLCSNAAMIRQNRDVLLENLLTAKRAEIQEVRSAQAKPLRCLAVKR